MCKMSVLYNLDILEKFDSEPPLFLANAFVNSHFDCINWLLLVFQIEFAQDAMHSQH